MMTAGFVKRGMLWLRKGKFFSVKSAVLRPLSGPGQCPGCHEWNTMVESLKPVKKGNRGSLVHISEKSMPSKITEVATGSEDRYTTKIGELDRVLGGGIVKGSLTLVGGDPGIGKSTLLLQMCRNLAEAGHKVLYVSGEESLKQIKMRADRIGEFSDRLMLLSETCLDSVEALISEASCVVDGESFAPSIVIIDSIQTVFKEDIDAAPGSVSQVREMYFRNYASCQKRGNISIHSRSCYKGRRRGRAENA